MKMLTMPHYFPEDMPWEARRKILLEVCGDVTDTEVCSISPSCLVWRAESWASMAATSMVSSAAGIRFYPGRDLGRGAGGLPDLPPRAPR